ncbi:unnamed protein product [Bemisia tabaci]|uniref:Uncharacterized protein n=1 Tax=Bemisia tabaci TaxID=7038 RepID=A0A9P0AEK4_BEMTA|nr:unnamed protein product [Bemisia tabaci]
MAMGEFRRTHSKVWWSHYPSDDGDDEDGPSGSGAGHPWGPGAAPSPHWGPGLSLSGIGIGERRFSSSPSSGSHKSQDSGFSDSESSSPSGSTRSTSGTKINKSPLKEEEDEARDDVSDGVRDDVSDGVRDDVSDGVRDDVSDGVRDDVSDGVRDDVSDGSTPEPKFVDPMLLRIPLSRIPRVCLAHKSKPDPEAESKIAPNENIIIDIKEEVSQDELTRRYKTEPRKCEPSYQRHSVSLELHSSPFQFQLPPKFNSMECLLNEQNLFSSTRNTPRRRSSLTDDSDASPPPSPKPVRKSTCKIVEEIPKKSFLQALNASRLDSSEKENIQPNLNSSAESRIPDKNSNLSRPLEKNSNKSLLIGKSLRECRPCEKNSNESHPSDSFTECRPCEKNSNLLERTLTRVIPAIALRNVDLLERTLMRAIPAIALRNVDLAERTPVRVNPARKNADRAKRTSVRVILLEKNVFPARRIPPVERTQVGVSLAKPKRVKLMLATRPPRPRRTPG